MEVRAVAAAEEGVTWLTTEVVTSMSLREGGEATAALKQASTDLENKIGTDTIDTITAVTINIDITDRYYGLAKML